MPVANSTAADQARAPHVFRHLHLLTQFTRREVLGRYRGSYLGVLWTFVNPLLLLGIFTFVFKYIFHARFTAAAHEGSFDFALMLFAGLIIYNVFAECLGRAPTLILSNANYVTKVVFPLEILPVTVVLASLLHLLIGFIPLGLGVAFLRGWGEPLAEHGLPGTILLWPVLLLPMFTWALGITYLLAALGVFLRDLNQAILAITTIVMYASAVFYRLDQVDEQFRRYLLLNPLVFFCESSRNLAVRGAPLDWSWFAIVLVSGTAFMVLSYWLFMRVKRAFADVI